jgi:hypothetical protein
MKNPSATKSAGAHLELHLAHRLGIDIDALDALVDQLQSEEVRP